MYYKYELLHYTRKNRKISLREIGQVIGVSESYLSLIEKGKRNLSFDMAVKISNYLETTPDELFLEDHRIFLNDNKGYEIKCEK